MLNNPFFAVLLSASFISFAQAPFNLGFFGFLGFIPLFRLFELSGKLRFLLGWLAGFLLQAFGYYWIFFTIRDFSGQNEIISFIGSTLFWLYQGLDLAIWLGLTPWLVRALPIPLRAFAAGGFWMLLQGWLFPYVFPWNYVANLTSFPVLATGAWLWSAHGLSCLVICLQGLIAMNVQDRRFFIGVGLALLLPIPLDRLQAEPPTKPWRIGVIQPNVIPWAKKARRLSSNDLLNVHIQPSLSLADQDLDLLIWPETALTFDLQASTYAQRRLQSLAERLNTGIVLGAVGTVDQRYTNEIWLFDPDNAKPQIYQKEKLVLFSERLPLIFSWAKLFDPSIGGFVPGRTNRVFFYRGKELIPLVCFEALFPTYARRRPGHLILNLTNDAWFGETKASQLHLQQIQMRTIENQVPLVRATNSGISCWVDASGSVQDPGSIYQAETFIFEVPLPGARPKVLSHIGEGALFWMTLGVLLVALIRGRRWSFIHRIFF